MERQEKSEDSPINGNILLMVKNTRALNSVKRFLMEGGKRATQTSWMRYLEQVRGSVRLVWLLWLTFNFLNIQLEDKTKSMLNGGGYTAGTLPLEKRLLYNEAGKVRNLKNARESDEEKREEEDRLFWFQTKILRFSM